MFSQFLEGEFRPEAQHTTLRQGTIVYIGTSLGCVEERREASVQHVCVDWLNIVVVAYILRLGADLKARPFQVREGSRNIFLD